MSRMEKKVLTGAILASAVAMVLASPAFADSAMIQTKPGAHNSNAVEHGGNAMQNQRDYRLSNVIGRKVLTPEGVDFGTIEDVVINLTTGDVRYAILSVSGDVGPGETRFYAVSTNALTMGTGTQSRDLVMNSKGSAWREKSLPWRRWPDLRNTGYWSEVDRLDGFPAVQPTDEGYFAYRGSELIGKKVQNVEGKPLGTLRDMVINMNSGKVQYAALDFRPEGAQSDKLVAIPMSSFIFREDKRGDLQTARPLELDIEPATLNTMQGFTGNHWPDLNKPSHVAQIDSK